MTVSITTVLPQKGDICSICLNEFVYIDQNDSPELEPLLPKNDPLKLKPYAAGHINGGDKHPFDKECLREHFQSGNDFCPNCKAEYDRQDICRFLNQFRRRAVHRVDILLPPRNLPQARRNLEDEVINHVVVPSALISGALIAYITREQQGTSIALNGLLAAFAQPIGNGFLMALTNTFCTDPRFVKFIHLIASLGILIAEIEFVTTSMGKEKVASTLTSTQNALNQTHIPSMIHSSDG